jgi:hypothetical protein
MIPSAAPSTSNYARDTIRRRFIASKLFSYKILPISPLRTIFCGRAVILPICFQYFAEYCGRGFIAIRPAVANLTAI